MFQLEHTGGFVVVRTKCSSWNILAICSSRNILAICSCTYNSFGRNFVLNVPVGTFGKRRKLSAQVVDSSCGLLGESMDSRG